MDRIISARIDEAVIERIGLLATQLKKSKKAVIEEAIRRYADTIEANQGVDILDQTLGAWQRRESEAQTVAKIRNAFRRGQERYKR